MSAKKYYPPIRCLNFSERTTEEKVEELKKFVGSPNPIYIRENPGSKNEFILEPVYLKELNKDGTYVVEYIHSLQEKEIKSLDDLSEIGWNNILP